MALFQIVFFFLGPKEKYRRSKKKKQDSGDCTTVATQPRQLHYSNNFSKKKEVKLIVQNASGTQALSISGEKGEGEVCLLLNVFFFVACFVVFLNPSTVSLLWVFVLCGFNLRLAAGPAFRGLRKVVRKGGNG